MIPCRHIVATLWAGELQDPAAFGGAIDGSHHRFEETGRGGVLVSLGTVTQDVLDMLKHQFSIRPADIVDALHELPADVSERHGRGSRLWLPLRFDGPEHGFERVDAGDLTLGVIAPRREVIRLR
jgi:hypothetical protein